ELVRQPLRLIALICRAQQRHRGAALFLGEERLAQARGVFGDDAVGGVEDDLRRAVVLLQPPELRPGKVVLEREPVPDVVAAAAEPTSSGTFRSRARADRRRAIDRCGYAFPPPPCL